jgi:uncharacterized protein (DUF1330 family)
MVKNALLVTASVIVGAGGVQLLHAQSKAPAYSIAMINDIKDEAAYKAAAVGVRQRFTDRGGKYLVIAGAAGGTGEMTSPTGDKLPSRLVMGEFANIDAANKWWKEAGEKDFKELGQYATLHLVVVEAMTK